MKTDQMTRKFRVDEIDAASYNPRNITESAMAGLRESLDLYGMLEMPVVNLHGGKKVLVSGHQRMKALKAEGMTFVDCVVVDFEPARERMANIAMNNSATQGKFDSAKAMPEIQRMLAKMENPSVAGFAALMESVKADADKLMAKGVDAAAAEEKEATKEPAAPPVSKVGKLYRLGRHTLWCGDMKAGAKKLMPKRSAALCVTDPPYNVGFDEMVWQGSDKTNPWKKGENIAGDDLPREEWVKIATDWFSTMTQFTNGPVVMFYAAREVTPTLAAFTAGGGVVGWPGIWVKDVPSVSPVARKGIDYHFQTEPFLVGWRTGVQPAAVANCWNTVRCPRQRRNEFHPTQKPVALLRVFVERHSEEGALVYDPFLGSGSTLMACEEAGRVCVGSELSPVFCDRIRQRWARAVHGDDCDWMKLTRES